MYIKLFFIVQNLKDCYLCVKDLVLVLIRKVIFENSDYWVFDGNYCKILLFLESYYVYW